MQRWPDLRIGAGAMLCVLVWLASAVAAQAQSFEPEMDRPGLDFKTFELSAPLPAHCQKACNEDAKCKAWTFAWPGKRAGRAHCSLKTGEPEKKKDNCCISGLRSEPVAKPAEPAPPEPEISQPEPPKPEPTEPEPEADLATQCEDYARTAVEMNEENDVLVCGLTGSRWGFSYDRYHAWCMEKSTAETRKANTEARARELERCRTSIGLPSYEQTEAQRIAEREKDCQAYARRAARQAGRARERGCNVSGPRWLTAQQPHFSWCMTASKEERDSETKRRDNDLAQCVAQASAGLACEDYARVALDQAREAFERRCGFEGSRWRRNYGAHKAWCRTAGENERADETRIRARALNACRREPRIAGACARFAASAVSSAKRNLERGCGFRGTRWSLKSEDHFFWCMNARPHERRKERATRFRSMLKCTKQGQTGEPEPEPRAFEYRWRAITPGAGDWSSKWIATGRLPACEHLVRGCQCGAANYCGSYRDGDVALWWPNGCIRRPWEILCEIRPR